MISSDLFTNKDQEILKIVKNQHNNVDALQSQTQQHSSEIELQISKSEKLLQSLGYKLPEIESEPQKQSSVFIQTKQRDWDDIVNDANSAITTEVSITDLLSDSDVEEVKSKIENIRAEFDLDHKLDGLDYAISGIAGTLGTLVDIFMVKMPSSPGFLGGDATDGGSLSDFFRKHLRNLYSPEEIKDLEKKNWVPYDAATSQKLPEDVAGLYPRSHRLQSLGHDPILGFIFGIRDIMNGEMTAIDKYGKVIIQEIEGAPQGVGLFQAIALQIGHLKSDIGTAAGLPAPFLSLFQLINIGSFGEKSSTVAELARYMYLKGYDFGHFMAMSVPVMVIEVVVRLFYFLKRIHEGHSFMESLPINLPGKAHQPKLQTMLFTAHTIATAANAGKVYFYQNPLAINLPQWLWMAKSTYSQVKWFTWDKEKERLNYTQKALSDDWEQVNIKLAEQWAIS